MNLRDVLILEARIKEELENMEYLKKSLEKRSFLAKESAARRRALLKDEFVLRAVGTVLLDYYTAAENIFKEIAKTLDGRLPAGSEWHKDLMRQMKLHINGIRPAVLSKTTFEKLDEYRRFRHLVRNIYGFNLLPDKVEVLLDGLMEMDRALIKDLESFLDNAKKKAVEEITGESDSE